MCFIRGDSSYFYIQDCKIIIAFSHPDKTNLAIKCDLYKLKHRYVEKFQDRKPRQ